MSEAFQLRAPEAAPKRKPVKSAPKTLARAPGCTPVEGFVWDVEPHVCAECFGRILSRKGEDHGRVFRCADCGATGEAAGRKPPICACNIRIGTKNAGVRCVPNPNPRPELPAEIIAQDQGET